VCLQVLLHCLQGLLRRLQPWQGEACMARTRLQ
jgi:hypothetical protein